MSNIITHAKCTGRCLLCYFMAVLLSWAAFPLIMIVLIGYVDPDLCMCIYTLFSSVIYIIISYQLLHGFGEKDSKPYNWARYGAKGAVCAAIAYLIITSVGHAVIILANKYVIVHHPTIIIETLNGYLRMGVYMPFYWLFRLIEGRSESICPFPSVEYLNSVFVGLLTVPAAAFGYWMGFTGRRIYKGTIKNPFLRRLFYGKGSVKK